MAAKFEEVLTTNLLLIGVTLLNTPAEASEFRRGVNTEVRAVEVGTPQAGSGAVMINRTYFLDRDRIAIQTTPDRSLIAREYPERDDLERLAEVASVAIEKTNSEGQELPALGYNIDLVYEPDTTEPAIQYLAGRLFQHNLLQGGGTRLLGGAGRLYFEKDGQHWEAALEPRLNDAATSRIFVSLNLHIEQEHLLFPTRTEVQDSFNLLWEEAQNLVNQLHGSDVP